MSLLEKVFVVLCHSNFLLQLVPPKRSISILRVNKTIHNIARACPLLVHVKAKAPGKILEGPTAALSACRHKPTQREKSWLYVLHGLEKLSKWARVTGLDLSAMGPCCVSHNVEDVIVPLVEAHRESIEVLNLNNIQMSNMLYQLLVVGGLRIEEEDGKVRKFWDLQEERELEPGPLAKCKLLKYLDLSGASGLYSKGAGYLAQVLPHMTSLRTLILQESRIGDDGMQKLAEALDNSPSVSLVDVRKNDITPQGIAVLVAAFENRDPSHLLILRGRCVWEEHRKAVEGQILWDWFQHKCNCFCRFDD